MCSVCDEEDEKIALLREARTDRSVITDNLLEWLMEYINNTQGERIDRSFDT